MPFEVSLTEPFSGYALADAADGEMFPLAVTEFTSSADGERFLSRVEGFPHRLLSLLPQRLEPSTLDHLIAIIRRDNSAKVYANECSVRAQVRLGRRIEQDEEIYENDIIDIGSLNFDGVIFPPDAGVVCLFSSMWRKGLFFDLRPLHAPFAGREFDVGEMLGACMSRMIHQDMFTLTDEDWEFLFAQQWFPFATLSRSLRRNFVGRAKRRTDMTCLVPQVSAYVRNMLPHIRVRWPESPILRPHLSLLLHALDRFDEDDYVSCTAILFPRIEGVLRTAHEALGRSDRPTSGVLSDVAVEGKRAELHEYSWMMPTRFEDYMRRVYFAGFDPQQPAKPSRHSVAHGVASADDFNAKSACVTILALDQVFFLLPSATVSRSVRGAES